MKNPLIKVMQIFLPVLLLLSIPAASFSQKKISVADYGSNPDDGRNVIMAVRSALKACSEQDSSILVFPKGRYDFWPDFTSNQATIGIQIEKIRNLTVDGCGSEFIFHGKMQIAGISGCENIKMSNFSADWDHPFIAQGQYVEAADNYIDLRIDPEVYIIQDSVFFLVGEGWKSKPTGYFTMYDRDKKEILYKTHDGVNGDMFKGKAMELEPGLVRFYGKPQLKPAPGTWQVMYAGTYITTGIQISESRNTYLKDITIYHALSNGVYGFRSENITMDNVNMAVNERKGRVFSIVADASHFTNCKGLIRIINCRHTGQGDDFINVHGTNTLIASVDDDYTVITGGKSSPSYRAGDEVWLINKNTSQRGEIRTVKAVERPGTGDRRSAGARVTFTQPLPKDLKSGDFIENKTWNARVEIRNCEILKKNRARGILVTTPEKVIIENNYFRTAGTAILIEGDTEYWFESGANNDVTIRNNVFEDCLTSGCATGGRWEWGEAIITITPSFRPLNENSLPYHKNIRIENNTFKTFDTPLVHARAVGGLLFNNNEIIRTYTYEPYAWLNSSFRLNGCRDVKISGNHFSKDYVTRSILLENMKKSDLKVDRNQGFSLTWLTRDNDIHPVW